MGKRRNHPARRPRVARLGCVALAGAVLAIASGCAAPNGANAGRRFPDATSGRRLTPLALPTPALAVDHAGASLHGRNDHLLGSQPPPRPLAFSETVQIQRLRIVNGRPYEHTHVRIQSVEVRPGR